VTIPRVHIDLVQLWSPGAAVLAYAFPRSVDDVPIDSLLYLSFSGLDQWAYCRIDVSVGGAAPETAYESGVGFSPGWAGPGSAENGWQSAGFAFVNNNLDITIEKETPWPEKSEIVISYRFDCVDGTWVESQYRFSTADETAPVFQRATVEDMRRISLEFDEDLSQDSVAMTEALLVLGSGNGFVPDIKEITASGRFLHIVLTEEMSYNAMYMVKFRVADMSGNITDAGELVTMPDYPIKVQAPGRMPQHWIAQDREGEGNLDKLCNLVNEVLGLAHKDIVYSLDAWNADRAYSNHVRDMLKSLGYDFLTKFISDRKAMTVLWDIYRRKGMRAHLPGIIYTLVGVQPAIEEAWDGVWTIGEDVLGETTVVGDGSDVSEVTFRVVFSRALTDEERQTVRRVLDFAKPSNTLYVIDEPTEAVGIWTIGESVLGEDTIVG
jgi:hypothetical protein